MPFFKGLKLDKPLRGRTGEDMTRIDRIRTAIWAPAAITVALVAMYWDGTGRMGWGRLAVCAAVAAVCRIAEYICERRRGVMARDALKKARQDAGMTQQEVAEHLGIKLRTYQDIEYGHTVGKITHWDSIEDLFGIPQRQLRKMD